MKTNALKLGTLIVLLIFASCNQAAKKESGNKEVTEKIEVKTPKYDTSDPQSMLKAVEFAYGGWSDLWKKGDVEYTYRYHSPAQNKTDLSTERYIFNNEASFGHYTQHEINVMPDVKGEVSQYFNGESTVVMVNGEKNENPQGNAVGDFLRRANYFWFVMPYKLNDKGTIASYEGKEEYNGIQYDKLNVTYDSAITGKEQNDIYILYINPDTKRIDRFLFSLPFLGVNDPVLIANYEYEDIDGQLISTKRTYFLPNDEGEYSEDPSLVQTMSNISFSNGFTQKNIVQMSK